MSRKKVIIVGAGFGGLNAALSLKKSDVDLLIIDKTNFHLFQPLLYQVASAALSSSNIASPIRQVVSNQKNTTVIMGEVINIDKEKQTVSLLTDEVYSFDYLILAPGASHSYFGKNEWEQYAPGLKTIEDALLIREKIFLALETAERLSATNEVSKEEISPYLRYVIVGGGPTGVEMAGAIAEITRKTLLKNYDHIQPELSEIYLIEGEDVVLPAYPRNLSETAKKYLEDLGVTVLTNTRVSNVTDQGVEINGQLLATKNIIWAAGNQASPLLKTLQTELDRAGRAVVKTDLTIQGYSNIFVIGDAALLKNQKGEIIPGIAPAAMQEGRYVAKIIAKDLSSDQRKPFSYFDKGSLATIGRAKAVGLYKKLQFTGLFAWLIWSFVHVFYLISFPNRLVVMIQWIFLYFSNKRPSRLISSDTTTVKQ